MTSRRLAAVDIGSNTVHVLVAEASARHGLRDVAHHVEMPELGTEVASTGRIGEAKSADALAALESVIAKARVDGFEHLVAGATAAVRKAEDGLQFLERASRRIGVEVQLISEKREAELSFMGVASRHAGHHQWLMVDLGGASTELVAADGPQMGRWVSLALGSGVMASQHLSDPPGRGERARLRQAALPLLRQAPDCEAEKVVATGGSASNLPLVLNPQALPAVLTTQALLAAQTRLDAAVASQVARETGLWEGRIRALRAGVELLLLILDWYGVHSLHISHEGVRHGMLLGYLAHGDSWWQDLPIDRPPPQRPGP